MPHAPKAGPHCVLRLRLMQGGGGGGGEGGEGGAGDGGYPLFFKLSPFNFAWQTPATSALES